LDIVKILKQKEISKLFGGKSKKPCGDAAGLFYNLIVK